MAFPTISGLTLRLESDLGITKDGSNRVAQWDDQAAVYGNYTQGTDDSKPVHTANIFGSKSGLLFDGSNDFMANAAAVSGAISASAFEIFSVVRWMTQPAAIRGLWNTDNGTAGNNVGIGQNATAGTQVVYNKPSGTQTNATVTGTINKKGYLQHALRQTGTGLRIYDGYAKSRDSGYVTDAADTSATALGYGSYLGRWTTAYSNCYLGAVIIFNRVLTEAERQSVLDYLISEYNIQYPALFVDPTSGNDSTGDGLAMSTAWKTMKAATAKATLSTAYGYRLINRNGQAGEDIAGAAITATYGGTSTAQQKIFQTRLS